MGTYFLNMRKVIPISFINQIDNNYNEIDFNYRYIKLVYWNFSLLYIDYRSYFAIQLQISYFGCCNIYKILGSGIMIQKRFLHSKIY